MPRCDEIDRRLIELLIRDVRTSNKTLAARTGISVWTVASRLERLRAEGVLVTTVAVDWKLAGFDESAFAFFRLDTGAGEQVTAALVEHPRILSVVRTFGSVDVVVHVIAEDRQAARRVTDELGGLPGVSSVRIETVVEVHRLVVERATLPIAPWDPADLPRPTIPLDDVDRQIVSRLIEDGHESNRKVAAELDVSESTVRARLRRLEESGLLRVVAMFDPFVLGEATAAYFTLESRGTERGDLVAWLSCRDDVPALISCLGSCDVIGLLVSRSVEEIADSIEEIRSRKGVRRVEAFPIVRTLKYQAHLTRFLDGTGGGI